MSKTTKNPSAYETTIIEKDMDLVCEVCSLAGTQLHMEALDGIG
jgi:hypothetical protein